MLYICQEYVTMQEVVMDDVVLVEIGVVTKDLIWSRAEVATNSLTEMELGVGECRA